MFSVMSGLFLAYIGFFISNRGKLANIIVSMILILFLGMYGAYIYKSQKKGTFRLLSSRLYEDTRSGVVENFYRDMQTMDWILGKGISGEYFCPGIDEGHRVTVYREVIETGYLQIILKRGIVSIVLFSFLAIPALFRGLFRSRNLLCKASALWILWYLINTYAATYHYLNITYLLVWLSIGICLDIEIRYKTDAEIINELR
jgi:hypothetical protein